MSTTSTLTSAGSFAPQDDVGGAARSRLRRIGRAIWRGLELIGEGRAQREMRDIAERYDTIDPEVARRMRAMTMK